MKHLVIKQWWSTLSEREHKQLITIGILLLVLCFYVLIWSPLANGVTSAQQALDRQMVLNAWSKQAIEQLQAAQTPSRSSGSLNQIINSSTRRYNIAVSRMNPKNDTLNVIIEEVIFSDLLQWLAYLEQKQGLMIQQVDISAANDKGVVRVSRLVLSKA